MLIIVFVTGIKIHAGSKSPFAYELLAFTILDAIHLVLGFVFNVFNVHNASFYIGLITMCMWMIVQMQSWIFAIKYLDSSILCS